VNDSSPSSDKVLKFVLAEERPRYYQFGPFCLDGVDQQLFRYGEVVPLPPKTIETLLVLVQRHGQLVTKEVLMSTLWPETFVEEGSLTQNIFRLRKALGDDSDSERYIETVPRRGYRFVAAVTETEVPSVDNVPTHRAIPVRRAVIVSVAAAVILAALTVFLARHSHGSAVTQRPLSPAAQEAYLKGRYHFERRTVPDFQKAVEHFRSAVEQEPRFARAWAGLADAYSFLSENPRAKVAAERALEIDPRLPEAHATLGITSLLYDFDWPAAERHFKRAIELNPSYPTAHHWYAFYFASQRRFDEALAEIERARALDPTSLIINTDVAQILLYARRYDEAIEKLREVVRLDSNFVQAHQLLMEAYLRTGDYLAAAEELRSHPNLSFSGELAAGTGDRPRALGVLQEVEDSFRHDKIIATDYQVARLHALLGNSDSSIDWLEKSLVLHDADMAMVGVDPGFDSLRHQPRFRALLHRMKLAI
jgi:DNA-binding winged helix-turn-helix (wHTH) protein/thioredoxin-like negative regulator of GroEL